jgi:crotonobetainyl-CoA:carnitine CoA-transferase CaiB-like acyl-CoA transferase
MASKPWTAPRPGRPILTGIRVVELATVVAAPSCAAVLADLGASVIKIERLGVGDTWRLDRAHLTPDSAWGGGPHFANNNRGKQSIQLDIKDPVHLEALKTLLSTADVFVTNVRSKALDRSGLGYPALSKEFPSLVYAILSAWGLDGPRMDDPGYDVGAFWAAAGLQDFSKPTDGGHVGQFPPALGDHLTAMQLVAGIALALFHRQITGEGQLVDASLLRSGIWGMAYPMLNVACAPGQKFVREPRTQHYRPSFNSYKCSDGGWLQLLGLQAERFMPLLSRALMLEPSATQGLNNTQIIALFDGIFASRPLRYWEERLRTEGVWFQRVTPLDEVLCEPQAQSALNRVSWASFPVVACPVRMSCSDQHGPAGPPPQAGEHTAHALLAAGVSEGAVTKIMRDREQARSKL